MDDEEKLYLPEYNERDMVDRFEEIIFETLYLFNFSDGYEINIGDDRTYVFMLDNNNYYVGSIKQIRPQLLSAIDKIEDAPFLKLELAEFLKIDGRDIDAIKRECYLFLKEIDANQAQKWAENNSYLLLPEFCEEQKHNLIEQDTPEIFVTCFRFNFSNHKKAKHIRWPNYLKNILFRESKNPPLMITLCLENLPLELSNTDLTQHFSQYANVVASYILSNRETDNLNGYGFVEIANENIEHLINDLKGTELNGRALIVKETRQELKIGATYKLVYNANKKKFIDLPLLISVLLAAPGMIYGFKNMAFSGIFSEYLTEFLALLGSVVIVLGYTLSKVYTMRIQRKDLLGKLNIYRENINQYKGVINQYRDIINQYKNIMGSISADDEILNESENELTSGGYN
jgi:RNA recognition motif-containing protein